MEGGLPLGNTHFATIMIKTGLVKHHQWKRCLGGKFDEVQNIWTTLDSSRLFVSYNQEKYRNYREEKSNNNLTRWSKLISPQWTDRHHEFPDGTPWEGHHVTYAVFWARMYNLNRITRKPQTNQRKDHPINTKARGIEFFKKMSIS